MFYITAWKQNFTRIQVQSSGFCRKWRSPMTVTSYTSANKRLFRKSWKSYAINVEIAQDEPRLLDPRIVPVPKQSKDEHMKKKQTKISLLKWRVGLRVTIIVELFRSCCIDDFPCSFQAWIYGNECRVSGTCWNLCEHMFRLSVVKPLLASIYCST